jgi:hypothetical protein
MIQRIQTVYFLIVIVICALMFFIPVYTGTGINAGGDNVHRVINFKQSSVSFKPDLGKEFYGKIKSYNIVLYALNIIVLTQVIVVIVLFRNRKLQLKFTWYCLVLSVLYAILLFTAINSSKELVNSTNDSYGPGAWLPLFEPVLLFMGILGIKKDIRLVKSSDRLR